MNTYKIASICCAVSLSAATCSAANPSPGRSPAAGTYITIPDTIVTDSSPELTVDVERGLFVVPGRRADPNSRIIAVAFIRFPALRGGGVKRPAVFLLPGGPGEHIDFRSASDMRDIERLRRTRDVVYVSQRGNPPASGMVAQMYSASIKLPLDKAGSLSR